MSSETKRALVAIGVVLLVVLLSGGTVLAVKSAAKQKVISSIDIQEDCDITSRYPRGSSDAYVDLDCPSKFEPSYLISGRAAILVMDKERDVKKMHCHAHISTMASSWNSHTETVIKHHDCVARE